MQSQERQLTSQLAALKADLEAMREEREDGEEERGKEEEGNEDKATSAVPEASLLPKQSRVLHACKEEQRSQRQLAALARDAAASTLAAAGERAAGKSGIQAMTCEISIYLCQSSHSIYLLMSVLS